MYRFCLALTAAFLLVEPGTAHYNMLMPQTAMAKKGDKVPFVYQFGHPFEHELFDAPQPTHVVVRLPDGKGVDLTKKVEKFKKPGVDGKEVTAYRFDFTPEQRGDHWFVLMTPPIWMEESKEFYQDTVQVVLHVQTQNGWDKLGQDQFGGKGEVLFQFPRPELMQPLTRPYGLLPGMVFQALVAGGANPNNMPTRPSYFSHNAVEIERYNPQRPKVIPADELVTFRVKFDPKGIFTCTLTEPGWWCMTAQRESGQKKDSDGKNRTVYERTTLWVHVETKAAGK